MTDFPALSPGMLFASTTDGGVLYDLVEEELSFLNATATAVAVACADRASRHARIVQWASATGADPEAVEADVAALLEQFRAMGIVGRDAAPPQRFVPEAPVTPLTPGEHHTVQAAGEHRIRFRGQDGSLVDAVAKVLGMDAADDAPTADFHLIADEIAGLELRTDTSWSFRSPEELVTRLITVVNDFVARTMNEVVLHAAAAITPGGATVVFPAPPQHGKSTLVAALAQRAWTYLGDENATIRHDGLAVVPCAKPLTLDDTSRRLLGLFETPADPCADRGGTTIIATPTKADGGTPPDALGPDIRVGRWPTPPTTMIVLPHFAEDAATSNCNRLDPTEALVALVGNTLNLRYVDDRGLQTLVNLAETVPVHRIVYRSSDEAVGLLEELGLG